MSNLDAILKLKKALSDKYGANFSRLLVFGSVARGDDTAESDVDVMVEMRIPVDWKLKEDIISIAYDVELDTGVMFETFARQIPFKGPMTPFEENLDRDGVAV